MRHCRLLFALAKPVIYKSLLFPSALSCIVSIGRYTLFALGTYQYNCPGTGYGNVTAVPAKHSIALCKQCSNKSQLQSALVHSINVGDLVEWSVATEMQGQNHNCTMLINQLLGGNQSMYYYSVPELEKLLNCSIYYKNYVSIFKSELHHILNTGSDSKFKHNYVVKLS